MEKEIFYTALITEFISFMFDNIKDMSANMSSGILIATPIICLLFILVLYNKFSE